MTAPPGPTRYLGRIADGVDAAGQTLPVGQGVAPSVQTLTAWFTQAGVQVVDPNAPQHSGIVLQTWVVQGLQSQGSTGPFGVLSSCEQ